MSVNLKLLPYNDLWLDCIKNNLMSILISHNNSLSTLPFTFKGEYWKKIIFQKFDSQDTYQSLLEQGLFLPKVTYNTEILYSFFDFTEHILKSSDLENLHELIQNALSQQQFIFLSIDRFFYPTGREANKIHFIHPVFIHNISDINNVPHNYEVIEDCLSPGRMHHYNLPFEVIYNSTRYLLESGHNVSFRTVALNKQRVNNYTIKYSQSTLLDLRNIIAADKVVYQRDYDLYYQVGIGALDDYFEEFEEIISTLNDESMFALRTTSFIQNHKKNALFLKYLFNTGIYNNPSILELAQQSSVISNKWEVFKNVTLKNLRMNNSQDIAQQKEYLQKVIVLERESIRNMRLLIKHFA